MEVLKKKTFYTIFIILSLSILILISVYNVSKYIEERSSIKNSLNVAKEQSINASKKEGEPPANNDNLPKVKYLDNTIYTILINSDNSIKDIINNSNTNIDTQYITKVAKNILSNPKNTYIGFLYFNKYAYTYIENNSLIILDTSLIRETLLNNLGISLLILISLELVITLLSKKLTIWLVKPAIDTLNKQKEFIADASHELKTPLAVIMASTDALSKNFDEKWLKNIKIEIDRMNSLITSMLELSRLEKKNSEYKEEDLSNIVTLSALTFEGIMYEANIKLDYHIEDNIKYKVNKEEIQRLVEILLDNAVKHSKIDNKHNKVNLILESNKDNIILKVSNYGDTITDSDKDKIFERFYRIDKSRNRSNNNFGLGLAIAKNIVINHKGKISVESKNNYTTFKVLFKK